MDPERRGQTINDVNGWVSFAPLYLAQIGAVHRSVRCQSLLCDLLLRAKAAKVPREKGSPIHRAKPTCVGL